MTPPESDAAGLYDDRDQSRTTQLIWSTPRPGRTSLIRAISSGQAITLRGGRIILYQPDGRASHWESIESDGWLGFRNAVSGTFLGRDNFLKLCCSASWHKAWVRFRAREKPEGAGSILLMDHWWSLRHVGVKVEDGMERLAVIENWEADEVVWEFVEA